MRKPVLTIFYQFNPWQSSIGGIQTIVRSFLKYAAPEFDIRLVGTGDATHSEPYRWYETEYAGRAIQFLPVFSVGDDNTRRRFPTTVRYTAALLGRSLASDFMHFHRLEPTLATYRWPGEKTFFLHNDIRQQMEPSLRNHAMLWQRFPQVYFAMERCLIGQFSKIFSCHTQSAKLYQERYPEVANRVSYLRNAVDTEIFSPLDPQMRDQARAQFIRDRGLADSTQLMLYSGRLHPQKDPLLLIRTLAALADSEVHLLIAGDGELRSIVEAEVTALNLNHRVTFMGALPQSELSFLNQIAHVVVLSSVYEGLPVTVLEALASGTPIVTTRCGETPNLLLPGSGLVSADRTPEDLAQTIRQVLQHPDQFPSQICAQAAAPYSAPTVIRQVYDEMLAQWQPTRSPILA